MLYGLCKGDSTLSNKTNVVKLTESSKESVTELMYSLSFFKIISGRGLSLTWTVKTSTSDTYILTITDAEGSYDTPNLKGGGGGGSASSLSDLDDVSLSELANGNILIYDSTESKWKNTALKLSNLADVTFTDLTAEQIAYYDGTSQKWKNVDAGAVSESEYSQISSLLS